MTDLLNFTIFFEDIYSDTSIGSCRTLLPFFQSESLNFTLLPIENRLIKRFEYERTLLWKFSNEILIKNNVGTKGNIQKIAVPMRIGY